MVQSGDIAPTFEAYDQNGELHELEDYEGEWIVLYFYPKDDTPGCTKEACNFRDNLSALQKHAVLLGVSSDSLESHKKFADKHSLDFPLLVDKDKVMIDAYGADGLVFSQRVTFLISPEGIIEKVYKDVDPDTHASELLFDLRNLQGQ
jgi:peroxiredoxin Q/BCP